MATPTLVYTPLDELEQIHASLNATFRSGKLQPIPYRKYLLLQLGYMIKDNAERISEALMSDMGKPSYETALTELGPVLSEVADTHAHLDKWSKPDKPPFSLIHQSMRRVVYKEGKGVCLIVGPFNYPISMCIGPVISALAAGNTVIFKPSEATPAMSTLFAEMFPKYLDESIVRVVNGGVEQTTKLLEFSYGHILFTGSGRVGRIVAIAAAKTFSPVTLELGGKSPVFIDPSCDLKTTARRILWGKILNSGQSCISPDYVIVPKTFQDKFVQALKEAHDEFFPDGPLAPKAMGKMIHVQAFKRVCGLLEGTKGTIAFGGETDEASKAIAPTVVRDCMLGDSLMTEEIFGPILPIIPVESLDEGIEYVNAHDHPLALYAFTGDGKLKDKLLKSTKSGSVIFNDTLLQAGIEGIPFGGIGPSGSGFHNGKYGFDTFTHFRASLDPPWWVDLIMAIRYPPYTPSRETKVNWLFASLPKRPSGPPPPPGSGKPRFISKWIAFVLALIFAGGVARRGIKH